MKVLKYVNASKFLPDYCGIPYSSWTKNKMRGRDNTGKPLAFSDEDKAKIAKGLRKLAKDCKSLVE